MDKKTLHAASLEDLTSLSERLKKEIVERQAKVRAERLKRLEDRRAERAKAMTIRGTTYRTQAEAAKAVGVCGVTMQKAKKLGKLDDLGVVSGHIRNPVSINGVKYSSISAAASALNLHHYDISGAMKLKSLGFKID